MLQEKAKQEYKLTEAEKRLVAVLCNPDYQHASVKEICEEADISRPYYYEVMKKRGFTQVLQEMNLQLVAGYINPLIKQVYRDATDEKNKNRHHQQRMLFEMAKMLGKDTVQNAVGASSSLNIFIGEREKETIEIKGSDR